MDTIRILHLEDSSSDITLVEAILKNSDIAYEIVHVMSRDEFMQALEASPYDVILSDHNIPGFAGEQALKLALEQSPDTPFIFVTGSLGEEKAIETFRQGATDYVLKDRLFRLAPAVHRAVQEARERTERRRAEVALRESQAQVQEQAALLDIAQDAIWAVTLDMRITYWNKGSERMFGWTSEHAVGKHLGSMVFANEAARLHALEEDVIRSGKWMGELNASTRAGKQVVVESRWSLVPRKQGRQETILVINTDITEKKQLEAQFFRAQRMESLGALAGGIAHDLNNVLSPVLMAIGLLHMKNLDEEALHWLDMLEASAQRGGELVKQILAFARGVEGSRSDLDVRAVVSELSKILTETISRSIQIQCRISRDLWKIEGDPTLIYQVLMNLCVNARDAMPQGGTLLISGENFELTGPFATQFGAAIPGNYVLISVSDTGTGIPQSSFEKIFDPFYTTKELGKGTGLGLATVKNIVRNHGGFLTVESRVGQGATFRVYFPAVSSLSPPPYSAPPETDLRGTGECLLMVDDEAAVREIAKANLEAYGYRVLTATDGAEGLATYIQHQNDIDLVLTDILMPFMDGIALIRALQETSPGIKILVLSGVVENLQLSDLQKHGTVASVRKPFSSETLLRAIRGLLKKPKG